MSSAYYYITLVEGDKAYELESYSIYELAERYALEMNIRTGAKPKVYYHSTLDNSKTLKCGRSTVSQGDI